MKYLSIVIAILTFHGYAQQIDNQSSVVNFRIGNLRINTVSGTFSGMTGDVKFNEQNPEESSFSVCIDASSVDTGISSRDEDLRGEKYFDVERFPEICFDSESIFKTDDSYKTRGKLTMKGVTRTVTIPFEKQGNTLRGTFSLNRLDYNVGEGVGTFLISDPVEVTIICVLMP